MNREDKHKKRIQHSIDRRKRRMRKYVDKISAVSHLGSHIPLHVGLSGGAWPDENSPTGYSQMCEWPAGSICQSPCNGDC